MAAGDKEPHSNATGRIRGGPGTEGVTDGGVEADGRRPATSTGKEPRPAGQTPGPRTGHAQAGQPRRRHASAHGPSSGRDRPDEQRPGTRPSGTAALEERAGIGAAGRPCSFISFLISRDHDNIMETKTFLNETPASLKKSERTLTADTLMGQRLAAEGTQRGRAPLAEAPAVVSARVSGRRRRLSQEGSAGKTSALPAGGRGPVRAGCGTSGPGGPC